jgi:hypothetical protein
MNDDVINYKDEELENEMIRLGNMSFVNNHSSKSKDFYIDDINLDKYDEIFELKKKKTKTGAKKVSVNKEEINRFYKDYERHLEEEIHKELQSSFKPFLGASEEDRFRANTLLEKNDFLKQAIDNKLCTYDEIVYFIDYYELISLMSKKKDQAVNYLQQISDLYKEDKTWYDLQARLERTLNQTDLILQSKVDLKTLFYQFNREPSEPSEPNQLSESNCSKIENSEIPDCLNNPVEKIKPKSSKSFRDTYKSINKSTYTTRIKEIKEGQINTNKPFTSQIGDNSNSLKSSFSSKSSKPLLPLKSQRNTVELFDNQNKFTNLMKMRKDRREFIKVSKAGNISSRPDLFKLDLASKAKVNNDDMKSKFHELLKLPQMLLDEDNKMDTNKKNTIKKRIEEAVNFYKTKFK